MFSYIQKGSEPGYEVLSLENKEVRKFISEYLEFASYILSCTQQNNFHSTTEPYFYKISKIVGMLS